jgi:hypothetical protein
MANKCLVGIVSNAIGAPSGLKGKDVADDDFAASMTLHGPDDDGSNNDS